MRLGGSWVAWGVLEAFGEYLFFFEKQVSLCGRAWVDPGFKIESQENGNNTLAYTKRMYFRQTWVSC